ncbi:MAG: hypothetical protein HGB00_08660 [Chlorobiaceae bacterium]|nr:hypothetical protein [Chlorobiaceae bacterium]
MKKLLLTISMAMVCSTSYAFGVSDLQVGKSTKHDVAVAQSPNAAVVIKNDLYAYEKTINITSNAGSLYTVYHFNGDTLSSIEQTNNRP